MIDSTSSGGFFCICDLGFIGQNCETPLNPCATGEASYFQSTLCSCFKPPLVCAVYTYVSRTVCDWNMSNKAFVEGWKMMCISLSSRPHT